jgi:multidrug efflux system membrane fusion protein
VVSSSRFAGSGLATLALAALAVGLAAACSDSPALRAPEAAPVRVSAAVEKAVPVEIRAIGNVEPITSVSVKPQVEGIIASVHFEEGREVAPGDLLFTIDPRPFEAALRQAEAALAQDAAQAKFEAAQAGRFQKLLAEGVASKEQYEQARSGADARLAAVKADQAAVEKARLELGYCEIRSPLRGRTGGLAVHAGDAVKAHETLLVVINQIAPIYVGFAVPEQELAQIRARMADGPVSVLARARGDAPDDGEPVPGVLSFVDNAVDRTTGTIRLKATFANADARLWPGEFVNAVVRIAEQPHAIVVPAQAVQQGQQGPFVFVVEGGAAVVRAVTVGSSQGGESVIRSGVRAGDAVVIDGQLRLAPGAKVRVLEGVATGAAGTKDGA